MDEALATIGAFVVEKQQEGTLGGYYGENNDVYFAK